MERQTLDRIRKILTLVGALAAALLGALNQFKPTAPLGTPQPDKEKSPSNPPPEPKPDTLAAIGKIQFGNAGCSATIIGPRRSDGKYDVLTAAHCVSGQPGSGLMQLRSGKQFGVSVVTSERSSDVCWLVTDGLHGELPFALIADSLPAANDPVWHAGFGVNVPGNRVDGIVVNPENSQGQTQFYMEVSSGDSGGGVALDKSGRILSSVCCTEIRGQRANCWGCSVNSIRKTRPKNVSTSFDWTPIDLPLKESTSWNKIKSQITLNRSGSLLTDWRDPPPMPGK